MKTMKPLAMGLGVLLSAAYLQAGAQCRVKGTVRDQTGAGVADASISITTPSLTTYKNEVKTDDKGVWSTLIPDCTMPYHFKFEKEGYLAFELDKKIPIGDIYQLDAK